MSGRRSNSFFNKPSVVDRYEDPPAAPVDSANTMLLGHPSEDSEAFGFDAAGEGGQIKDQKTPSKHERLQSLDAFRGLTIIWMIFVDDAGGTFNNWMDHSPWNNIRLADFVFPFFVFIVGVSIPLAFQKQLQAGQKLDLLLKTGTRFVKLFLIGLFVQGGADLFPYFNLYTMRIPGILQRIGWCYLCAALVEIFVPVLGDKADHDYNTNYFRFYYKYIFHWLVFFCVTGLYLALMFGVDVPGCGRGQLTPYCNSCLYFDQKILSNNHMYSSPTYIRSSDCSSCSPAFCPRPDAPYWCYQPFDPEGILSSISAIGSALIGLYFGHMVVDAKEHTDRLLQWVPLSVLCLGVGIGIHFGGFEMNKNMWTTSFVLVMAGVAGSTLSIFYVLMDIWKLRLPFQPLVWVGMNAILIFFFAASDVFEEIIQFVCWSKTTQQVGDADWFNGTFIYVIQQQVLINNLGSDVGQLLYTIIKIIFWVVIAGILKWRGYFWKV